jgi:hypothetical protein
MNSSGRQHRWATGAAVSLMLVGVAYTSWDERITDRYESYGPVGFVLALPGFGSSIDLLHL